MFFFTLFPLYFIPILFHARQTFGGEQIQTMGLLVFGIFLVAYLTTHYVSLGSVLSSGSFGFIYAIFHWEHTFAVIVGFILSFLIVWMHRANIVRLLKGQERKTNLLGKGKQK